MSFFKYIKKIFRILLILRVSENYIYDFQGYNCFRINLIRVLVYLEYCIFLRLRNQQNYRILYLF